MADKLEGSRAKMVKDRIFEEIGVGNFVSQTRKKRVSVVLPLGMPYSVKSSRARLADLDMTERCNHLSKSSMAISAVWVLQTCMESYSNSAPSRCVGATGV